MLRSAMNFAQCITDLESRKEFAGMKYDLSRMERVKDIFGNRITYQLVHVAGTNGKGSTCKLIADGLSGRKVGLFTSPSLITIRDRIRVNEEYISEEDFARLYVAALELIPELTFFELLTTIAILYFYEKDVDIAVFEVGMGGRLDATNILPSQIAVITRIGIDHQKHLGDSQELIAYEKAGIIKEGADVFITQKNIHLREIFERVALERNAKIHWCEDYLGRLTLLGDFQKGNAGVARDVLFHLRVSKKTVEKSLAHTSWSGRVQWVSKEVLLDGAHNAQGLFELSQYVSSLGKPLRIMFGTAHDKPATPLRYFSPSHIYYTRASAEFATQIESFPDDGEKISDYIVALKKAIDEREEGEIILVTGSLYLVGDVLKAIKEGAFKGYL